MQRYIIVSGIPASGKSTLGLRVAAALGLPMLDKDEILEGLFTSQGVGEKERRRRLSRSADEVLRERALLEPDGAVIASWWRHPDSRVDSGTPVEWLSQLLGDLVELHCVCSPEVAADRFLARPRHPGHLDSLKKRAELLAGFQQHAALGPLGLCRLVEVNTERGVELQDVISRLASG